MSKLVFHIVFIFDRWSTWIVTLAQLSWFYKKLSQKGNIQKAKSCAEIDFVENNFFVLQDGHNKKIKILIFSDWSDFLKI